MGRFCVRDDETSTFVAGQADRPSRVPRAYDIQNVYTSAGKAWTRAVEPTCSRIRSSNISRSSSSSNSSSLYLKCLMLADSTYT